MIEEWKDVIRFEKYYQVSNLGNIRRKGKNKNLSKVVDKDGYIVHCFSVNNIRYNVMAHKIVAEAFIGPYKKDLITRHIDGNPKNNIPDNLVYGTNKENSEDMLKHGTQCKGINCHLAKLSENDVNAIRSSNKSQKELSELYGVSQSTIYKVINLLTWRHL